MEKMQSVPEALIPGPASLSRSTAPPSRHSTLVRATHWIIVLAFLALLVSGIEILISHPRFYWGENGNVLTPVLFKLPIPSERMEPVSAFSICLACGVDRFGLRSCGLRIGTFS
jgi:hypothetical protein